VVKLLPSKCKALSPNPNTTTKKKKEREVGPSRKDLGYWRHAFQGDCETLTPFSSSLFPPGHELIGFAPTYTLP
jgi:hypothetical protein